VNTTLMSNARISHSQSSVLVLVRSNWSKKSGSNKKNMERLTLVKMGQARKWLVFVAHCYHGKM
jgi:hypothetical protein